MENKEVFCSCDLKAYLSYGSTSNQVKPKMKLHQEGPMENMGVPPDLRCRICDLVERREAAY